MNSRHGAVSRESHWTQCCLLTGEKPQWSPEKQRNRVYTSTNTTSIHESTFWKCKLHDKLFTTLFHLLFKSFITHKIILITSLLGCWKQKQDVEVVKYLLHFSEEVKAPAYNLFGHYLQEHTKKDQIRHFNRMQGKKPQHQHVLQEFGVTYSTLQHHPLLSREHVRLVSATAPAPPLHIPATFQTSWTCNREQHTDTPGLHHIQKPKTSFYLDIFVSFSIFTLYFFKTILKCICKLETSDAGWRNRGAEHHLWFCGSSKDVLKWLKLLPLCTLRLKSPTGIHK